MLTDNPSAPFILVVEDDEDHQILIERSFDSSPENYRLTTAGDLHDARQILAQQTPDLILADYCLPDGRGCDLLNMVNGICPVVIVTSQGDKQLEVAAKEAGALDYVVKSLEGFASMPCIVNLAMHQWVGNQDCKQDKNISD
jgi:DNA-binding response OmpR family regulator